MISDIDKHLAKDTLDDVVDILHKDLYNINPEVGVVAHKVTNQNYVSFTAAPATAYPVFGEVINKRPGNQELTTYDIFDIKENSTDKANFISERIKEISSAEKRKIVSNKASIDWDIIEFVKKRQSLTLDIVNPTSQAGVLFGMAMDNIKPPDFTGNTYSIVTAGMSIFDAIKLSKEKVIVTFKDNNCIAILDANDIADDIDGILSFDLHAYTEVGTLKLTTVRFNLSHKTADGFVYVPLDASCMLLPPIGDIQNSNEVYIHKFRGHTPLVSGDDVFEDGDDSILNKTSHGMIVWYENGKSRYLPPYGIIKGNGASVIIPTRDYTFFMSKQEIFSEDRSVFGIRELSFDSGSFLLATKTKNRYMLENNILKSETYNEDGFSSVFGFVLFDVGYQLVEGSSAIPTGISGVKGDIYAISMVGALDNMLIYQEGESLYAKLSTDVAYTRIEFSIQTHVYESKQVKGLFGVFHGQIFLQQSESMTGQVWRNKHFLYEVDYGLLGDPMYGYAFPIDFFRVKRIREGCSVGEDFPFSGYDKVNTTKNCYDVGSISRILSDEDGQISIINAIDSLDDIIDTRYRAVFSFDFSRPVVVKDFGFISYSRGKRRAHPAENWLSKLIRGSDDEASKISYCGTNEQEDPEYGMFWVRAEDTNTKTEKILILREYDIDGRVGTDTYGWMNQSSSCEGNVEYVTPKIAKHGNPNKFHIRVVEINGSTVGDSYDFTFKNIGNTKSATSIGDGILSDLSSSINFIPLGDTSIGMYFVNHQMKSSFMDTILMSGGPIKHTPLHKDNNLFFYAIPEIGFVHASESDYEWLIDYTVSEIRGINTRGIQYTDGIITVTATLEYNPVVPSLCAKYQVSSINDSGLSVTNIVPLPEWHGVNMQATDKDDLYPRRMYPWTDKYDNQIVSTLLQLKSIPSILSNKLFIAYGHTQCVLSCWDESIDGILLSEDITLREEEQSVGSRMIINKNGVIPAYIQEIAPLVNIYNGDLPHIISSDLIVRVKDSGLIETVELLDGYRENIEALSASGKEEEANLLFMKMIGSSFPNNVQKTSIEITPLHYMQQDPWKKIRDYSSAMDKMMLDSKIVFIVPPGRRINLNLKMGIRNEVSLSHPATYYDENYIKIDGIVERELLSDGSETDHIQADHTYTVKYRNFPSGLSFLKREIVLDLERYPNRRGYQKNNILRELASPIREDAHSKKMDGRSVAARWDMKYSTESIREYSELFYELPTAFTCDSLPEEATLNRSHKNYLGFFNETMQLIKGENLVALGGEVECSFSNPTDENMELRLAYKDKNFQQLRVSYPADKPLLMYQKEKLWPTFEYNGKKNRVKSGIRLVNTTIIGD